MPRKKNYEAPQPRAEQARPIQKITGGGVPAPDADGACIDMVSLLGPGARFGSSARNIDLSDWLGRGIDAWVWASVVCLKAMLRSGARETATVTGYSSKLKIFFAYLTDGEHKTKVARPAMPADLSPIQVQAFVGWLQKRGQALGWTIGTTRHTFNSVKSVLLEMFAQGFVSGEPSRFLTWASLPWRDGESQQTSLSDGEQERLAQAIKSDLVAIHHGRVTLNPGDVQALRLLLVAHRQGKDPTPLLELPRDALSPGFLPGTVRIRTAKYRNRKLRSGVGRAAAETASSGREHEVDVVFSLAEGAVLQQAIVSTRDLADEAPTGLGNRVWLYRALVGGPGVKKKGVCHLPDERDAEKCH